MKTYLTNARMVLFDEVIEDASLLFEEGVIRAINPDSGAGARQVDLKGKLLMPGMIDLHCDALEKEVEPRPNVHFPLDFACAQADRRNAAAGITTVYHALSFADDELGVRNNQFAADISRAVHEWRPYGLVDNRVHCRYEITDETGVPILQQLLDEDAVHLISMMDHTPGQGQFKDVAAYRDYLTRTYEKTADEVDAILKHKIEAASGAFLRMQELATASHRAGIAVASHDDDSVERVETMKGIGADISEFPISMEAAKAARQMGMSTIFGAPNILRGKSQSGSMKAVDAIRNGVADCLCGDYSPAALIVAIMKLPKVADISLAEALQLVTVNPARAVKLHDRGAIEVGKRADLVAVELSGELPLVTDVWVKGEKAFSAHYSHG